MVNFEVIIGIENHVELKTKTKMFSPGPVTYGAKPNSMVNLMDIGYPGIMPTVNKKGVELALIACKALNLTINPILQFDRKNYFYPDLAKGFQITQHYHPIGRNGYLTIIDENNYPLKVIIERLHIEEDTAKQLHKEKKTLLDYNRSGIGLIEIVTKPILHSGFQVRKYLETLREILIYTQISDAKMNEGSLRCDINISLRQFGTSKLGHKVELKNLNSIYNIEKAIEYEINRQTKILLMGRKVAQETRRFDENTKTTVLMRKKTNAIDYKYFSEPNIFPIKLSSIWINNILNKIPELPEKKRQRYLKELNLKINDINLILQDYELMLFFEKSIKLSKQYEKIIYYLINDIKSYLNKKQIKLSETALTPQNLITMIELITKNIISNNQSKIILQKILIEDYSPKKIIKDFKLKQINNKIKIKMLIKPIFNNNLIILKEYNKNPKRVIKFFMGKLMNLTKGQINPKLGKQILIELINKNETK